MEHTEHLVIRVYGIAMHEEHILLCDEFWFGTEMTKFPGGGLEYGEGTIDCLKRECMEELGQEVEVLEHFYTTDFFQPTRFLKDKQLISIYYRINLPNPMAIKKSEVRHQFPERTEGSMAFRWCPFRSVHPNDLTFPVDRVVVEKLRAGFRV